MPSSSAIRSRKYRAKDVDAYRKNKREYARTPEQRAKRNAYMAIWRERNREKHNRQARESHARNSHKHKQKRKDHALKVSYGLTRDDYNAMLASQDGVCFICRLAERAKKTGQTPRNLAVDHCHATGKIRGLLCTKCNGNLGWFEKFKDSILRYLDRTIAT
jgi:hypothetical protein